MSSADTQPDVLDVVAIDGPSGAGKSTVAKRLAASLGFAYLDTGALYRAVTWLLLQGGRGDPVTGSLDLVDRASLEFTPQGRMLVNGRDVTDELRARDVESQVSAVAARSEVRTRMRDLQRQIARSGPLVAEGRDMGSVVFPHARWKFYLDASPGERAKRRQHDFAAGGRAVSATEVLAELQERDRLDSARQDAPLIRVEDATYLDSTQMSADQVVQRMRQAIDRERS